MEDSHIAGGNNPLFRMSGKTNSLQERWESEFRPALFWHWTKTRDKRKKGMNGNTNAFFCHNRVTITQTL